MPARLVFLCLSLSMAATALAESIDFNQQVRPILANNCFNCHGPDQRNRKAELRLDVAEAATKPREGGAAIVPGSPEKSALIKRVLSHDPEEQMPPPKSKNRLSEAEVATLRQWITEGAPYAPHWAFLPLRRDFIRRERGSSWPANGIDHWIEAKLAREKLVPSAEASRGSLARRLWLDLLGLLPSPEELDRFVRDEHLNATERLADRLLANPHHGERWGRHWLDQARYADSDGYSIDAERPMWPYRDWVIAAINEDKPFDEFTTEQLAGDLIPDATQSQCVATAFHRNTLVNMEGGSDPEQFRVEAVVDRVNTTGTVWLGLSVGCAQCHDHKYDPISHREYYQLLAFFNSTEDVNEHEPKLYLAKSPAEAEELEQTDAAAKSAYKEVEEIKKQTERSQLPKAEERLKELTRKKNAMSERIPSVLVIRERETPRQTHVHIRGDFLRRGEKVAPEVPAVFPSLPANARRDRLSFAGWLVSQENPLTPRVTVNRVWMRYFGRGLVETENDFGTQGSLPTHPELLDWLSRDWLAHDWSPKWLHRRIVTSRVYQQASQARSDLAERDPLNLWLGRQTRLRVDAEIIRDLALSASGLFSGKIGGPSVRPPQPDGVYAFTQRAKTWNVDKGEDRYRRGLYTFFYRSAPHPGLSTFDVPNFQTTCTHRARTNTPLQALATANDEAILELAKALGGEIARHRSDDPARIAWAFQRCLCRPPTHHERDRLLAYAQAEREAWKDPWPSVARVLLNLDEFLTRE